MANVSANIGANTQQAESSIGRLLASLRKLRQESSTGVGMKMFASDEVNKLSTALNQAIAAAGALNKLDLSQFDQSLRRSAELLKRNADNYLRAQQAMGNQGVAGRFAQQLGAGGNPLNPNFGQMFPGMQGAALKAQMEFYFKSMLRGTGMSGGFAGGGGRGGFGGGGFTSSGNGGYYSGGGGRGGTTGHGGAPAGDAGTNEGSEAATSAMLASLIKKLKPIAATYLGARGLKNFAVSSLAASRENAEAEDTLLRMTRDGGGGVGNRAMMGIGNQAGSLANRLEAAGKRVGLSGTEAMKSAQVYANAAQQVDRDKTISGFGAAAGYARAYGLNINQTAGGLGGLQRTGAIGSTPAAQNEFLLKMAQTLKGTGMTANADQAIDDLAQTVDQYISHDLATPNQGKLDEFAALRAVTYATPGLSGKHGQNLLGRFDENMRSDSNDARNIMMAVELQKYGIDNVYTQNAVQAEGANFDLSTLPGWKGKKGMTYGELAVRRAHQVAVENAGAEPSDRGSQAWTDWDNQVKTYEGNLLNEAIPGAHKLYEIYEQRDKDKAKLVDSKAQLARYGLTPESFKNTSGVKDAVDLMGMDNPEDVRAVAKRYADRLDLSDLNGTGGTARAEITALLNDQNSSPEAIKKRTLAAMAQFGQHGSLATTDRAAQAEENNALVASGRTIMDEWNTTMEVGAISLKEFAKSADGAKSALDGLKEWFNTQMAHMPNHDTPGVLPPGGFLDPNLFRGMMGGMVQPNADPAAPAGGGAGGTPAIPPPGAGGGTPTPLGPSRPKKPAAPGGTESPSGLPLASTSIGEDLLNLLVPPANASVTPTPTTGWNNNPGTIPPDIANTSPMPKAPKPTATGGGATGGTAAGTSSLDATSGHVQARDIYDYLVNEKGVSPSKAVAVVTNIEAESGFKVNTVHDGGTGYGMFGHRDPNGKSGRRSALFKHAGTQTPSAKQQLDYALTESEYKQFAAVDNGGDHRADTASFTKIFESPKNENLRAQERAAKSDNYASYMGSGPAATQSATVPADTGGKAPAAPSVDTTGLNIEDQSDPNFGYGESATANKQPFKGIIFHHTSSDSLQNEVNYGKTKDAKRGGAFGYHYYVGQDGKVVQGAPLDKRTNHIKPGSETGLSNKNSMGISLVGAKDGATPKQLAAAKLLGESVMASNSIDSKNIYGHGELQKDRMAHEGVAAADQLRKANPKIPTGTGAPDAKAKPEATAAKPGVPADTGSPTVEAPANTGAASKGGKSAVPGVDVPFLKDVPSSTHTQTPEEAAAQAAKDADAARQAKDAKMSSGALALQKIEERNAAKAAAAQAAKDVPGDADGPYGTDQLGNPIIPGGYRGVQISKPAAPGDTPVDADASKVVSASGNSSFSGSVDVNVHNHNSQGVRTESKSTTLKAGSGGTDNIPKGVVTIGTAPAAPQ